VCTPRSCKARAALRHLVLASARNRERTERFLSFSCLGRVGERLGDGELIRGSWSASPASKTRRSSEAEESVGRATHDPPAGVRYVEIFSPFVAGIIGAGRSWTAWTISVLSIPRRYTEVIARSAWPSWRWMTSSGTPSRDISTA
jgi:hypothetical protein